MAIKINFDKITQLPEKPLFILCNRNGDKIGTIPHHNLVFRNPFNSYSEISFRVYKETDKGVYGDWDKLKDFKLLWCKEWNMWYELSVELDESNNLIKNVIAKSLGESELSQTNLYGVEINTEDDILRDDYEPSVLYDSENPKASILHRILEKAPHYSIGSVSIGVKNIQRTFTFDNITIYDALQEISQEINCLIEIDTANKDGTLDRKINVYDLESYCLESECGHRGEFLDVCPKCKSANVINGYGNDTPIFVSTENLSDEINYSTNIDSVKNCFKLEAGDDLMTAAIASCNPNGSNYIWYISEDTRKDMSEELQERLSDYDEIYEEYQNNARISLDVGNKVLNPYNQLVYKYEKYSVIYSPVQGYSKLISHYYDTIDFELYLTNRLSPVVDLIETTAIIEANKITSKNIGNVSLLNLSTASVSTITNAVLSVVKTLINPDYRVSLDGDATYNSSTKKWSGKFNITNYSDETDTKISSSVSISIVDTYSDYVNQELRKTLANGAEVSVDIVTLFGKSLTSFNEEIRKYGLSQLNSFRTICQTCLNLLIEQGIANKKDNLYTSIYVPYYNKLHSLDSEIRTREAEIATIVKVQNEIENQIQAIHDELDFQTYICSTNLGQDLWTEFVSFRREDTYSNNNYISDGLNNAELISKAQEFLIAANKEIIKSATLQHSISSTLKNLLVLEEFEPLVDNFELGNFIRVRIDDDIYRLRLIEYEVDFDNLENISVTFSDVVKTADGYSDIESILSQASSMASSYGNITRQAEKGNYGNTVLKDWVEKGLALTNMKIINNAENQNITWDSNGILCREYYSITDSYDDKQLKIINKGLYVTNDNWETAKAGVGNFTFYNPKTGEMEESYGVIADTLIGNLILSEEVGIYNPEGSISLDKDGFTMVIDTTVPESQRASFKIQTTKDWENYNDVIYFDDEGNANFKGKITATSLFIGDTQSEETEADNYIQTIVDNKFKGIDFGLSEDEVNEIIKESISDFNDGLTGIYYQASVPTSPAENDIWYNISDNTITDNGKSYPAHTIWKYTNSGWVDITDGILASALDIAQSAKDIADSKINVYTQNTDPTNNASVTLEDGDLWINTSNNEISYWDDNQWNKVESGLTEEEVLEIVKSSLSDEDGLTSIYYQDFVPTSPAENDVWYNTSNEALVNGSYTYEANTIWKYTNSEWTNITNDILRSALDVAESAKAIADSKVNVYTRSSDPKNDTSITLEHGDLWINIDNNEISYWDGKWNAIENNLDYIQDQLDTLSNNYISLGSSISETYKNATDYADSILNNYITNVGQYMNFDPETGLVLGSKSNEFQTVIDNQAMRFKDNGQTVAYITNQQLNIESAIINSTLFLGNFMFAPHSNKDGGFSLTWSGNINFNTESIEPGDTIIIEDEIILDEEG